MTVWRIIATHLVAIYLGAGLFAGLLMERAVPAMNAAGVAFVALTWPRQIICARAETACSTTPPAWAFSFKEDA